MKGRPTPVPAMTPERIKHAETIPGCQVRDSSSSPEPLPRIGLLKLLHEYGLMRNLIERESTAVGVSLFGGRGVFRADLHGQTWSDSGLGALPIEGGVIELVQRLEGLTRKQALEVLSRGACHRTRRQIAHRLRRLNLPAAYPPLTRLVARVPYLEHRGISAAVASSWGGGLVP